MNLIVDIGNTRAKYAIFDGDNLVERGETPGGWHDRVTDALSRGEEVDVLLASTGEVPAGTREHLQQVATSFREATTARPLPLRLDYETPATLGIDRVAACVAGAALYPARDLLVVDAGTAITFNHASATGVFLGGNISPGIQVRYRALHHFTARLPLLHGLGRGDAIGKNTGDAIREGVMRGVLAEIRDHAAAFLRDHPRGVLLLTGGDGPALNNLLHAGFLLERDLVMTGLNNILEYQKTNT